jgi:hypothetical protein
VIRHAGYFGIEHVNRDSTEKLLIVYKTNQFLGQSYIRLTSCVYEKWVCEFCLQNISGINKLESSKITISDSSRWVFRYGYCIRNDSSRWVFWYGVLEVCTYNLKSDKNKEHNSYNNIFMKINENLLTFNVFLKIPYICNLYLKHLIDAKKASWIN